MLDVLKRIFIGVIVGLCLFFLKSNVFALSLDQVIVSNVQIVSSSQVSNITIADSTITTPGSNSSQFSFMNTIIAPATSEFFVIPTTWVVFNELENETTSNNISAWNSSFASLYVINAQIVSQESGYSTFCELQNNYVTCPVTPGIHYTGFRLQTIKFPSASKITLKVVIPSYASWFKRSSSSGTSEITESITSATQTIEDQTDELLDADAPSDHTYNNDYSTNSYDQAEASMNQNLDVDVSDFTFDPTQWAHSFSYIWFLVTSFVTINNRVFATITGFLTLSFVGLVIGRS